MWEPDPSWRRLPGAGGPATRRAVARRGRRPHAGWSSASRRPTDAAGACSTPPTPATGGVRPRWRAAPELVDGPGLVPAEFGPVEEDDEGADRVEPRRRSASRRPGCSSPARSGASPVRGVRRTAVGRRDGCSPTVSRWPRSAAAGRRWRGRTLADVTDRLWQRREHWLRRAAAEGRRGGCTATPCPRNFLAAAARTSSRSTGSASASGRSGSDLGYFALSSREEFDVLLEAFLGGVGRRRRRRGGPRWPHASPRSTRVVSRAEWALAQAARGEGALAGKFRHPAVAPHLRALQRQFPQIEALL